MENINDTLKRFTMNSRFQQQMNDIKREVINHPDIREFLRKHQDEITTSMIEKSLMKLYEYKDQSKDCRDCPSLDSCVNMMKGFEPEIILRRDSIDLHYRPCKKKRIADERKKSRELIQSIYVPKEILQASFGDFSLESDGRLTAYEYAERFAREYELGKKMKGLYLYGKFGVGKSYLLGAIANHLAENKQISSLIVYVPEFFREMKQSLSDHSTNEKLEVVKKAPLLMLDDIGAEVMTSWTRDEILGSIMQFRMQENLPTFFSSNFDYGELQHHLTYSQRGEEEKIKAARIMERIKYLSIPIRVDGPNMRH
ncbi:MULTISPECIES: primosomal protein DnaI [Heyndrickxia]|jgi:primosomal protein DnaI|uniref:Primosomal protein DnaI n=1 Tax=Heyndrickxia oleronia TaxID=38875 RepID=A0A8E2I7K2_9BACI|nr:primosomal protein DnaI [Heyndrickxia oleronia]NYV64368.1 primosomal protein DnaI [Bacillus sp. Gen3]MBU5212523.1 primosomal protein DnaI [Heyndrickxia oleronia]MCI1590162.1 primosomal protein DnaI [Heyndrickxia oleronia]MCI1613186.1 primosomal protein DnaI [Heyndrickxia oleronia]MCI1744513.1 primosomal protein DnaI [Heyndrickxia oleronia]